MLKYTSMLVVLCAIGCANSQNEISSYQTEAQRYCDVHTIEYWQENNRLEALNNLEPTDKQRILRDEIHGAITSKPMREIIFVQGESIPAKEYYAFLQKRIPELTKQNFICPAIEEFYVPKS